LPSQHAVQYTLFQGHRLAGQSRLRFVITVLFP
jgi:hypothetical protein